MPEITFRYFEKNKYSIAALLGALEANAKFEAAETRIVKDVGKLNSATVLCYSFHTPQVSEVAEEIKKIKKLKEVTFIAGGVHASAMPNQMLELGFDYVVTGEGEKAFPKLLCKLYDNDSSSKIVSESGEVKLDDLFLFP
jgi:radical SAM superfamily enzyme YgiQ (UPF0313 family)